MRCGGIRKGKNRGLSSVATGEQRKNKTVKKRETCKQWVSGLNFKVLWLTGNDTSEHWFMVCQVFR